MGNGKFTMASNKYQKASHSEFTIAIWIDYYYWLSPIWIIFNLPNLENDLTHD